MMTHETKKPFACKFETCDKSYCDARSLRRHIENHHQADVESIRQLQIQAAAMAGLNLEAARLPVISQPSKLFPFEGHTQFMNSYGGDPNRSPSYLQQVSPISPAVPTSPLNSTAPRTLWTTAFNPLESVQYHAILKLAQAILLFVVYSYIYLC